MTENEAVKQQLERCREVNPDLFTWMLMNDYLMISRNYKQPNSTYYTFRFTKHGKGSDMVIKMNCEYGTSSASIEVDTEDLDLLTKMDKIVNG